MTATTLSLNARGDSLSDLKEDLYRQSRQFFGSDYTIEIPEELDCVIESFSDRGKYFAHAYIKGSKLKNDRAMEYRRY